MLAAAEELERVPEVGRAVRRLVAARLRAAPSGLRVYVNTHPAELGDDELTSLAAPLSALAGRVVLEVAPRAAAAELGGPRLAALRQLGYRLALDLGAGELDLSTLAALGPEVVKLGQGLTRGVDVDAGKQRLWRTMLELLRGRGVEPVAQGVETVGERDALVALGVDLLQGFLCGRPAREWPSVDLAARRGAGTWPPDEAG
jgi:EAL domain-containing protein (putative c-di-GMP-specific phosphodiesterase class I)